MSTPFHKGDKLTYATLNAALGSRLQTVAADGRFVSGASVGSNGAVSADPTAPLRYLAGHISRFRVKEVHATYLVCRTWDGDNEGTEDINVAI